MLYFIISSNLEGFRTVFFVVGFAKKIIFLNAQEICGARFLARSNTFDEEVYLRKSFVQSNIKTLLVY